MHHFPRGPQNGVQNNGLVGVSSIYSLGLTDGSVEVESVSPLPHSRYRVSRSHLPQIGQFTAPNAKNKLTQKAGKRPFVNLSSPRLAGHSRMGVLLLFVIASMERLKARAPPQQRNSPVTRNSPHREVASSEKKKTPYRCICWRIVYGAMSTCP